MTFTACAAITAVVWAVGGIAALLAAIFQVRVLVAVGSRYSGLPRTAIGTLASAPSALVVALLPGWLIGQFGCPDVSMLGGYVGGYAAAGAAYLGYMRTNMSKLKTMGFF